MNRYKSDGFRPVRAESMHQAAEVFAARQARKIYGRRGQCAALRVDGHARNYVWADYEAFIGYPSDRNQTTGHNFRFTVSIA